MAKIIPCTLRELPFATHIFVMARPVENDWSRYDGMRQGREEFRPCMIRGHEAGQRIYCIGSQYSYNLNEFELLVQEDLDNPYGY